ncbi:hypothetical protein F4782DRAFT_550895 [Xylaria castorea]|nr:hypothetical protein F4782DRAFT_550895 [Xylaria castorea]
MAALWHLGGEGREIVINDELRIVDEYDVRYRRSRGPKPNLEDPRYWEAKWEYFTDKYISFIGVTQYRAQVISQITLGLGNLPAPIPSSYVLSPIPSRVETLRPSSESVRAEEVKAAKETLYDILSFEFFQKEGRKFFEDDDVYIAGKYDVRYKHTVGPEPNLQDPQYWSDKIGYFYDYYLTSLTEEEQSNMRQPRVPPSESTWDAAQSPPGRPVSATRDATPLFDLEYQPQAPTAIPLECQPASVHDPMDKENCAPCPEVAITQATTLSRASKRKRGSHSDDTDQTEDQLSHPAKRSKSGTGQVKETRVVATGSSPAATPSSKTPNPDAIVRQLRATDPTLDLGAAQTSVAPVVVEDLEDRATRTRPQRRKRQRKTYEKERTSRRLAGQSPEFGLLPKRGDEPQPYEASSRRAATIDKTNSSGLRSGRVSKKPAAAKSTKSRATPKPLEGVASRQTRSKRN